MLAAASGSGRAADNTIEESAGRGATSGCSGGGAAALVRRLAAAGARVLAATPSGRTALHAAAAAGDAAVVSALLALGAAAGGADEAGQTPLHHLARCARRGGAAWADEAERIVRVLAAAGASLSAADRAGRTPMAAACAAAASEVAYALFDAGARVPLQVSGALAEGIMDQIEGDLDLARDLDLAAAAGGARVELLRTVEPGLRALLAGSAAERRRAERRAGTGAAAAGAAVECT